MPYAYSDLVKAYASLGVARGREAFVTSDLGRVSDYESRDRQAVLDAHFRALTELLGPEGTLVVPTASLNLCNTDTVFDVDQTPSHRMGALSEHVRQQPGAVRSFHPFVSYAALGRRAEEICSDCSRYTYGPMTPEARLIHMGALSVSVGRAPNVTCSTAHHVEQTMAVPYRYAKEYLHPVRRDGQVVTEPFYQYVRYMDSDIERCQNRRIFAALEGKLKIAEVPLGRGRMWSYPMADFFALAQQAMNDDPYIWCAHAPTLRPWQK